MVSPIFGINEAMLLGFAGAIFGLAIVRIQSAYLTKIDTAYSKERDNIFSVPFISYHHHFKINMNKYVMRAALIVTKKTSKKYGFVKIAIY